MARYALIQNNSVANVIDADAAFIAANYPGAVQVDTLTPEPGIGWSYASGAFTAPAPPPPPPAPAPSALYKPEAFMDLFTTTELKACLAYQSSGSLTDDQKANLNVFFEYFRRTDPIDLTLPTAQNGLQMLEGYGLIGSGRAAQILASRH